jgi:D-sedoheptulose 7-phosphate isomerase
MVSHVKEYIKNLQKSLSGVSEAEIMSVIQVLENARENKQMIFIMGNGGSASNASHFVNGLSQGATVNNKIRFKAIALTDNIPNLLAYGNDNGYESVFVEQLINLLSDEDVVIGISGSGNSSNVIKAIEYANSHNAITIGLTGFDGGVLKKIVQYSIHVPCTSMEIVEDIHLSISHLISSYFRSNS